MNDWIVLSGINESSESELKEFSGKRFDGAKKIADAAEEKGGAALLTRDHFRVKLPYYKQAKEGKFNPEKLKKEYVDLCSQLHSMMDKIEKTDMKGFQELLGRMEVVGELLIKNQDLGQTLK
jgi:hypothetical protein